MARRGSNPPGPYHGTPADRRIGSTTQRNEPDDDAAVSEVWAERLRRLALGLLAALLAARAYWPSEPSLREGAGTGLGWDLAVFLVAVIALAPPFLTGRFVFRLSWTDLAVCALMFLTALSARRSLDWRIGVNLAWDWAAMGLAYLLLRWLPRSRTESAALVMALVVTASSVAAYGIYQGVVEIPQLQEEYRRDPQAMQRQMGAVRGPVQADDPRSQALENRVLQSTEAFGTFGLANSLAGFLVGPLVLVLAMALTSLSRRSSETGSRWPLVAAAMVPGLILLTCLVLTKSRSSWIGLLVGVLFLSWQARKLVPRRVLLGLGAAGILAVGGLTVAGVASGRLDPQVLSQSSLSLRYRLQYWTATWAMITEAASPGAAWKATTFWQGVGLGSFGPHYLRYKLPEASEEILDPHNLFLESWATAGVWAFLALVLSLSAGLWSLLTPKTNVDEEPSPAGERATWLLTSAGAGLAMVLALGQMNLFMDDLLTRWLILAVFWGLSAALLAPIWRYAPIPAYGLGAACVATLVHLLAAGGIAFPAVAMSLWGCLALGLNMRGETSTSGRVRMVESRIPSAALALAWAALFGSYYGATIPFWKSEAALSRAEMALERMPPDLERADAAYQAAEQLDRYNVRPWLGHAYVQFLAWEARGAKPDDLRWRTIPTLLFKATTPPRSADSWSLHSERAAVTADLLKRVGGSLTPTEAIKLRASTVEAIRTASQLYPTNPMLRARLAEASADISMFPDAVAEAQEALRLDELLTPHPDKRLPGALRTRLEREISEWTEKVGDSLPASAVR